jgi:hypothetical protein
MNNKGQLGIGNVNDQRNPVLIEAMTPSTIRLAKDTSRNRISTLYVGNILSERELPS